MNTYAGKKHAKRRVKQEKERQKRGKKERESREKIMTLEKGAKTRENTKVKRSAGTGGI